MSAPSPNLYRMDRSRLWGRDTFAAEIAGEIETGCTIVGLEGVTGAGKSEFCFQLARSLQEERGPGPLLIDGGVASTEEQLVGSLCTQLRDVPPVEHQGFDEKPQRFLDRLLPGMRKIGGAMIKDIAKVAGLGKGEKTIEAVTAFLTGVDGDPDPYARLAEADHGNRCALIIEYLQFVTDLGNPLCIVIDDYELTEISAREFLKVFLRKKPENCLIIIAVNSERQPPSDWLPIMAPNITAANGQVYSMPDLTRAEIVNWYENDLKRSPDENELDDLIEASRGGRPAYIASILTALQSSKPPPRIPNFNQLQEARRRALSSNAKALGDLISLVPGDVAIPRSLLNATASAASLNVREAIDELISAGLIQQIGDRIRFIHSSYATSWVSELDGRQQDGLREIWYKGFVEVGYTGGKDTMSGLFSLLAPQIIERQSVDEIAKLASRLAKHGAQDDSLLLLDTSWKAAPGAGASRGGMIEHALQAARLQLDIGRYALAQEPLRAAELGAADGTPLRNAADLLRMKLSLRLNSYRTVWSLSNKLAKKASGDPTVQLERELILNMALRDLMDEPGIRASIEHLQGFRESADVGDKAAIDRSLARSFAKIGEPEEALRLAKEGLALAEAQGNIRAIGNAHFAFGETLRHAGQEAAAIGHYKEAIEFGGASGNRDSELWSWMGEAAAYLQLDDLPKAEASLKAAAKLTNDAGYEHPLETAHVALISTLIGVLSGETIDRSAVLEHYERLGIAWPKEYLKEAQMRGSLPRALPI